MTKTVYASLTATILLIAHTQLVAARDLATVMKTHENGIEIAIQKKPDNGILKLARLNNAIQSILLTLEDQEIPLTLTPFPSHWEIELPKIRRLEDSTVFIKTVGKPHLAGKAIIVEPDDTGRIQLHAHLATPVGGELRYEPQSGKNKLGHWRNPEDYPEWLFQVSKPGRYRVVVHQGCGPKQEGSTAEVRVGEQTLRFKVKDTGDFHTFEPRRAGTLKIESTEEQTLQIHITRLAKHAAMDLRLVELIPID